MTGSDSRRWQLSAALDRHTCLCKTLYFWLSVVRIDMTHMFHSGIGRDLVGSALTIIASGTNWFAGRNINDCKKSLQLSSCSPSRRNKFRSRSFRKTPWDGLTVRSSKALQPALLLSFLSWRLYCWKGRRIVVACQL